MFYRCSARKVFIFRTGQSPGDHQYPRRGCELDNPGIPIDLNPPQFRFVAPHCITTLTWTGGNRAPFLFNSYRVQGSRLSRFCLNAVGTSPPVFIDIDNAAGDIQLDDIVIDTPTTKARIAAIRCGNEGVVVGPKCTDVFVRAAAPIGFDLLNVQGHFTGLRCRGVWNDDVGWQLGDSEYLVQSFHCVFCTAEARFGKTPILIRNVDEFSWSEGFLEGFVDVDIPADAIMANQITLTNNFANGGGSNPVIAFVHVALPTATLTLTGNRIESGFLVDDEALTRATVVGNTIVGFNQMSGAVAKNGLHVCSLGNTAAPAPLKPETGVCN